LTYVSQKLKVNPILILTFPIADTFHIQEVSAVVCTPVFRFPVVILSDVNTKPVFEHCPQTRKRSLQGMR